VTDATVTYEIRVHWTRFGTSVAVVKTSRQHSGTDYRQSELISRDFGPVTLVPEMMDSAVTSVLMMLAELPRPDPERGTSEGASGPL
jgi:hypothetical protein